MTFDQSIYALVLILWLAATVHGALAVLRAARFHRHVKRMVDQAPRLRRPDGRFDYQPPAAIILPCCGVDEKLEQTVSSLAAQHYDDYEIIFCFESDEDAAYSAIGRWTRSWDRPPPRRVVAGRADQRSQKIHNLLEGVAAVSNDRQVLAFLDSDAVPDADWLGHIVAPLRDPSVGAATGYRWYVASGSLAAGVRSVWNAATMVILADERHGICWGGSTAIRRETFDRLNIARRWSSALSDDYQVTRAIHDAGLKIRFVPQALVPNSDATTLRDFWHFARRQVIITRVCSPRAFWGGLSLCASLIAGGTAVVLLFVAGLLEWASARAGYAALAGWIVILVLTLAIAVFRQRGLRRVLKPPDLTWRDFAWDVLGSLTFAGSLHLHLMLSALGTRRIVWRNVEYEMISPDQTRVIGRIES